MTITADGGDIVSGGTPDERAVMQALYDMHGVLTPQLVLEEASDLGSPLHGAFTWDDTEAGHRYRLQQAGHLIRRIRIERVVGDDHVIDVPAFVKVRPRGYVSIDAVVNDPVLREEQLTRLRSRLRHTRRELTNFAEFVGVVDAIDDALGE